MTTAKNKFNKKGFTLIELLIVMAILGVLAVVVLVAINPVQQLARTRDAGRIASISQIGRAASAFYTSRGGVVIPATNTWMQVLADAGELNDIIDNPAYSSLTTQPVCGAGASVQPDNNGLEPWCYVTDDENDMVVYTPLEADTHNVLCPIATEQVYAAYSMWDGRGGIICGVPVPGAPLTWVN